MKPNRHLVLLTLLVLSFGALASARALSSLLEVELLPVPSPTPVTVAAPSPAVAPARLDLERLARLTGLPAQAAEPLTPALPDAARSPLRLKLLGTLLADDPAASLAAVHELDSGRIRTARVGDTLLGALLVNIGRSQLIVERDGRLEFVDASAAAAVGAGSVATLDPGSPIRAVAAGQYEVPRAEVNRMLGNLNELATQVRIVPAFVNGAAVGFKVFAIAPGSLFARIGVQNGDVIRRINGYELSSPEACLDAYARLRDASQIELELGRAGATVRNSYRIL
jgi:general secretion pathway protein C